MDAQELYRQQSIETASPARLVSMLYHGAVAATVRAEGRMRDADHEAANRELLKAQAIVHELQVTLDFDQGGAIARNLDSLYSYCTEQLIEANLTKTVAPLEAARATLVGMAETWDQLLAENAESVDVTRSVVAAG